MVFRPTDFLKEYAVWAGMCRRCHNPQDKSYKWYGARGIRVCQRWRQSFDNFMKDMGPRPSAKYSIDRYPDNDGNYEPGNCRWATRAQQERGKRKLPREVPSPRLAAIFSKVPPSAMAAHFRIPETVVRSWKIVPRGYRDEILGLIGERPMPKKPSRPRLRGAVKPPPKVRRGSNSAGYEAVLAHFYVNGQRHGSKTVLASRLGVTRAVVDRWQRYGIPEKYAGPLYKLTGMRPEQIWPENYR